VDIVRALEQRDETLKGISLKPYTEKCSRVFRLNFELERDRRSVLRIKAVDEGHPPFRLFPSRAAATNVVFPKR
jgi:hypothetical protein